MKRIDWSNCAKDLGGLAGACLLVLAPAWAIDLPPDPDAIPAGEPRPDPVLAAYQALSESQARNYDRAQDISPRQLLILLEVCERTGASLGQALATGEHESARTWNDHVRPTLKSGNLGSAAGVWQFQPATFHGVIQRYGARLLAASEADAATGREHMDLGDGPFDDADVRALIQEAVDGTRDAKDAELQLLRHNFAVLAFAKHYLSVDSGATTPEEDYLFHFLGAGEGRRVLALTSGEARDTLSVKPVEVPDDLLEPRLESMPELAEGDPGVALRQATALVRIRPAGDGRVTIITSDTGLRELPELDLGSAVVDPFSLPEPAAVSSQWGYPADSPTVTGNLGMFYRDGKGETEPYTWAEFMDNLKRRVRAETQPSWVRAKYGVGFELEGGDMPERAFDPEQTSEAAEFRFEPGQRVVVPEALVTGPLDRDETERYKQRLAALVSQGDDQPTDWLPPESLSALHHLGVLPEDVQNASTAHPEVHNALREFRSRVGKQEPDDPADSNRLMPAERIALEIYDRRIARYAGLQACQQGSAANAPDLRLIRKMPAALQRLAAPRIAMLQSALAEQGLLEQPIKKTTWRDKKRRKRVSYKTVPFAGKPDKATVAALSAFQWRNGLRQTEGVMDAVTLEMLGLPPMGPGLFLPLAGPQCPVVAVGERSPICETTSANQADALGGLAPPRRPSAATSLLDAGSGQDCCRPPIESS